MNLLKLATALEGDPWTVIKIVLRVGAMVAASLLPLIPSRAKVRKGSASYQVKCGPFTATFKLRNDEAAPRRVRAPMEPELNLSPPA